eukprot:SAG31_NODE_3460_length_4248_cov_2.088696_4_plen_375_part_01
MSTVEEDQFEAEQDAQDSEDSEVAQDSEVSEDAQGSEDSEDTQDSEDEDDEELLGIVTGISKKQVAKRKRKAAHGERQVRPKKRFGTCSVTVVVGQKFGGEERVLDKFRDVYEPLLVDIEQDVMEIAEGMVENDRTYDPAKPGVLYSRKRDGDGRIKGKTLVRLDSQAALSQVCKDAKRIASSRQKKDAGRLHFCVKFDALPCSTRTPGRPRRMSAGRYSTRESNVAAARPPPQQEEANLRTVTCYLRGVVMQSGEDGSFGTVNADDGKFGCKTYGEPIKKKIDLRKCYAELEDIAEALVNALPNEDAGSAAVGNRNGTLRSRYADVKTSGALHAADNGRSTRAERLINSSQAADFVKLKPVTAKKQGQYMAYLS